MKGLIAGIALSVSVLIAFPFDAFAWNIPGHMLSGAIAYKILQQESPATILTVAQCWRKIPGIRPAGKRN